MSLNYARELLKISMSEICSSIGFDTTSEIAIDILVDICERQLQFLFQQTRNLIPLNDQIQFNYLQILFSLLENNRENINYLQEFIQQFQSIHFPNQIIQFPHKKRNQFYLRIPPKDSEQIIQRDRNPTTEYIYPWLPLFPDQETPEQSSSISLDTNLEIHFSNDQEKKFDKDDSHHPLTLLSLMSRNGDETNLVPIGKRPNRSLPSILYRPRRIIEIETANAAAAEKARKEQAEKENIEKDQQQTSQPPLRFTIPKAITNNDKPILTKKLPTTNSDGIINKKASSSTSLSNTNSPSINLTKKVTISPTINQSHETHSQPNPTINSTDLLTNLDQNEEIPLDLTKPTTQTPTINKLPTLKLNIKNVSNPQITNNSKTPPMATKKFHKSTPNKKSSTNTQQKGNFKIRTSSVPLFGNSSRNNETFSMISPPLSLPIQSTIISSNSLLTIPHFPSMDQQTTHISHPIDQNSSQNSTNDEEKKKKKKKKHHHHHEEKEHSTIKIEEKSSIEPMDIDLPQPPTTINPTNPNEGGTTIRLKIKLGKPSLPSNDPPLPPPEINPELKPNSIRLTLPIGPSNSQSLSLTRPPIVSTIDRTPHRRKSGKIQHLPQKPNSNPMNFSFQEDNTNSIDDLPLGERTSPNKILLNNIPTHFPQPILSTPIKKKPITTKKKTNIKRQNNIVGVAVIEERRIHHDSQEKIWICPSCNRPDNGQEAMIACDLCDDWYHWECVGIVEEPPESIPWFCPKCHRSNSSTTSAQGIKPSASSKAKRKRASDLYHQKQQQSSI